MARKGYRREGGGRQPHTTRMVRASQELKKWCASRNDMTCWDDAVSMALSSPQDSVTGALSSSISASRNVGVASATELSTRYSKETASDKYVTTRRTNSTTNRNDRCQSIGEGYGIVELLSTPCVYGNGEAKTRLRLEKNCDRIKEIGWQSHKWQRFTGVVVLV